MSGVSARALSPAVTTGVQTTLRFEGTSILLRSNVIPTINVLSAFSTIWSFTLIVCASEAVTASKPANAGSIVLYIFIR